MTSISASMTSSEIADVYSDSIKGKVAIVTGSNSGLGLQTAKLLAKHGAKVVATCRTQEKCDTTVTEIKTETPGADVIALQLELSDLDLVREFAKQFLALNLPLHLLFTNAGILACPYKTTAQGFEQQFGVNHLGHFLLCYLLMDKLAENSSRVIIVSSVGHYISCPPEGIKYNTLRSDKGHNPWIAQAKSKLANVLHAQALQRKFDERGADVLVCAAHPGTTKTALDRYITMRTVLQVFTALYHLIPMRDLKARSVDVGASTLLLCALAPDIIKGRYYAYNALETKHIHPLAQNKEAAEELWNKSLEFVGEN
jgi:retinol dehydrogenase 12